MKTMRVRTVLVTAGVAAMACDGTLLLDRGNRSSTAFDGGVDASAGGNISPPPSSGGMPGESGGSGGRTGRTESGGVMVAAGGKSSAAGGKTSAVGGAMNAAGSTMNAADGAIGMGGNLSQGSGGTFGVADYPDCTTPGGRGGESAASPATMNRWNGNGADCPSDAPEIGSECTVADGELCVYEASSVSSRDAGMPGWYACVAKGATHNVWVMPDAAYWIEHNSPTCPAVQPAETEDCVVDSINSSFCHYPGAGCFSCSNSTATWHCVDGPPWKLAVLPDGLDASKRVVDLSEDDRRRWCEWYDCNIVDIRATPQVEGDHTVATGCVSAGELFDNGTWAQLPTPLCMGNLRVSRCEATLQELTDCLSTFQYGWPIGAGCGRYFATPGCSGTIAVADDANYKGARGGAGGIGPGLAIDCSVRVQ
jgi:hypothetical protein